MNQPMLTKSQTKRGIPALMPILGVPKVDPPNSSQSNDFDSEMVTAQIRINTDAIKEIELLRAANAQLSAANKRTQKEKEFYKLKLETTSEQLSFLKKKMDKKNPKFNLSSDENDQNKANQSYQDADKDGEVASKVEAANHNDEPKNTDEQGTASDLKTINNPKHVDEDSTPQQHAA